MAGPYNIRAATYTGTDPDPVEWANQDVTPAITDLDLRAAALEAGGVIHTGPRTLAGVNATIDRAEARGAYTIAYFPGGAPYELGNGLSMAFRTAQIQGAGSGGYVSGQWTGTTFRAATQTGPVIDFTDYYIPADNLGHGFTFRISHGNFAVVGSGVADPTKVKSGVRLKIMSSAYFHDITVRNTGGPGWEHVESPGNAVYLCDFERLTVHTPVGAQTNDVPYFYFNESNGCRFRALGMRSTTTTNDCGVSGAMVITSNSLYPGYDTLIDGCWFEFLHIPTNGCAISIRADKTHIRDFGWHDIEKLPGATGTAYFRLLPPTIADFGGNTISGYIPGNGGGPTEPDYGVDVQQSRNRIVGIKGYMGKNVRIAAGVGYTSVELSGAESSATGVAVENNSAEVTNVIRDNVIQQYHEARYRWDTIDGANGGGGPRIMEPANLKRGAIWFGNEDARIQAIDGANLYVTGNYVYFRTPAFTPAQLMLGDVSIVTHTGDPNGANIWASPGSLCLSSNGTMWRKASGIGTNTGWVALS